VNALLNVAICWKPLRALGPNFIPLGLEVGTIQEIGQSAGNQRIVLDASRILRDYTQRNLLTRIRAEEEDIVQPYF
jgi:hypothetical protein